MQRHTQPLALFVSLGVLFISICACGGTSATMQGTASPSARTSPTPRATVTPPANANGLPTPPIGSPAITPTGSGAPAFTQSDVQAYFQQHPTMPYAQTTGQMAIANITFESSRAVQAALHGTSTGFADSTILCLVNVTGLFVFSSPPGATATYSQGFVVFNGATGNFIMSGGLRTGEPAASERAALYPLVPGRSGEHDTYSCGDAFGHCYAVATWTNSSLSTTQLAGVLADISYTNLNGGDGFVENEIWLVQTNSPPCADVNPIDFCWAEVGMTASSGQFPGTHFFWADNTPTSGYTFHDLGVVPPSDQDPKNPDLFAITYDGSGVWQVAIVGLASGSALIFAYSYDAMIPNRAEMGQELEGTSGASAGSADFSALAYEDGFVLHVGAPWITVLPGIESDNPPLFMWIQPPGASGDGAFQTTCC